MTLPATVKDYKELEALKIVRINIYVDPDWTEKEMCGLMFDRELNPTKTPDRLNKARAKFIKRLHEDGVWMVEMCLELPFTEPIFKSIKGIDGYGQANTVGREAMEVVAVATYNEIKRCKCCNHILVNEATQ